MPGFTGKILRVNLTTRESGVERVSEGDLARYFGGKGLATKILVEELRPRTDPFSPDNKLVFSAGPFAGTSIPGSSRFTVMAKSPLTGLLGEANCAGFFAREMKVAGYDAIVVEGRSEAPGYLWVRDDQVEVRDARRLWGCLLYTSDAADE